MDATVAPPALPELETFAGAARRTGLPVDVVRYWYEQGMIARYRFAPRLHRVDFAEVEAMARRWRETPDEDKPETYDKLRDKVAGLEAELAALSEIVSAGVLRSVGGDDATLVPIKGFYVYVLRDQHHEVVYVGQSRNVFGRVGSHVTDPEKGPEIETIQLISCDTEGHMMSLEMALIRKWQPRFNRVGVGYRLSPKLVERNRRMDASLQAESA